MREIKALQDRLFKENIALREEIVQTSMFEEIIGESPALQAVLARVTKVAPTDSTVLVTGETGTGKELIARAIHKRSQRAARAFVCVNCAAIPTSLISSELFGHEKERSPVQRNAAWAASNWPREVRFFSTRSESCRKRRKLLCSVFCRSANSNASEATKSLRQTCA